MRQIEQYHGIFIRGVDVDIGKFVSIMWRLKNSLHARIGLLRDVLTFDIIVPKVGIEKFEDISDMLYNTMCVKVELKRKQNIS